MFRRKREISIDDWKPRGPIQVFEVPDPATGEMLTLVREQTLSSLTIVGYIAVFLLGIVWYMFFWALASLGLSWRWNWDLVLPAIPLAILSVMLVSARVREQEAVEKDWPTPVMRQRTGIYATYVLCGLLLGATSGYLFSHLPYIRATGVSDVLFMIAAGLYHMYRARRNIPPFVGD